MGNELRDAGVAAGDEVILPGFGGDQAAEQVRRLGAVPVVVDIDPHTYCIDPESVAGALTSRTCAVAAVDLFGHPAPTARLESVVADHRARLVPVGRDAAESAGPTPLELAARRRNASHLNARLRGVVTPVTARGAQHAYTTYVVRVPGNGRPDRDAYLHALRAKGVECHVPVKAPVHRTPGFPPGVRLPVAEEVADTCLALPLHASLTKRELHRIVAACNALGGLLLDPAC
ncbi:DegT/DnrJ/EryC1/StrS family aminotransferase [Streptomyces sp. DSM 42041]|uniref:DegT/DnrJ/EryC1/StrS family aminotransferase n=1 Tax=Streptomyces hazeniae TaxID=3075538 RepID=A0ABU2NZ30_9ACTN|nr:DegT/DnrJ/EryC1/StrS family aminotransferase [Streptomyces sp. DSM 42041]MDT0382241.1 DegT/DnrJ/EryC1/StrS family aminotransferase [Streptomyces sp. DSM 42041]